MKPWFGSVLSVLVMTGLLGLAVPVHTHAQVTTGSIRGYVKDNAGAPVAGALVVARNPQTNFQRAARADANGFFNISGLPPGSYEVSFSGVSFGEQRKEVRVGVGQVLNLDAQLGAQAVVLEGVTAVGARRVVEVETPEVATNITTEQIENLPLDDRNFLELAALAPGVRTTRNGITAGGLPGSRTNVFIDGASFKNDILQGGIVGQDASLGNPFPAAAVQEFRVITQQFKAEYQKASAAVVTAVTKSGTNEWHGDVFLFNQNKDLIEQDFFVNRACEEARERGETNPTACEKPDLRRWQGGASLGGPIIRDRLFVFGTYETNIQDRSGTVLLGSNVSRINNPALVDSLRSFEGTFGQPFREHLYFTKLTYTPSSPHRAELSLSIRDEADERSFGGRNSLENAELFENNTAGVVGRYTYTQGRLLNEANVTWQHYRWHPQPLRPDLVGIDFGGVIKLGGRCCFQDKSQTRFGLRDDVTYELGDWFGDHIFKVGASVDYMEYDLSEPNFFVPQFFFDVNRSVTVPTRARIGFGDPRVVDNNTQVGAYIQDDWSVNDRLILNLGIRWDYESNMRGENFVLPDSVASAVRNFATTLPCGDPSAPAFRQLLCDPERLIASPGDREPFLGAFQPRVGFSYDLFGNSQTTLFGGAGLYYDRNLFGAALTERMRLQFQQRNIFFSETGKEPGTVKFEPGFMNREALLQLVSRGRAEPSEVFLMEDDVDPPYTTQASLGLRQAVGPVLLSGAYTYVRGYNTFAWLFGNRRPNGTCCEHILPGKFSNALISTDEGRTQYDALLFKAEKPYRRESQWGFQVAYTLAWAREDIEADGIFSGLRFLTPEDFTFSPGERDERHRITANGIVGLPLDFRLSGVLNLGSGEPFNVFVGGDPCRTGNLDCIFGNDFPPGITTRNAGRPDGEPFLFFGDWAFRDLDMRLEKRFDLPGQRHGLGVVAEAFNVLGFDNFGCFDSRFGDFDPQAPTDPSRIIPNERFGEGRCIIRDSTRRFQLGARYEF